MENELKILLEETLKEFGKIKFDIKYRMGKSLFGETDDYSEEDED